MQLTVEFVSAGALVAGGGVAYARFRLRRHKDAAEIERQRRMDLNQRGRISTGRILDLVEPETAGTSAQLLVYQYEVAGVTYEAAQDVTALPEIAAIARYLPGQVTSVKYDPKRPANSIFACEEWKGLPPEVGKPSSPQDDKVA